MGFVSIEKKNRKFFIRSNADKNRNERKAKILVMPKAIFNSVQHKLKSFHNWNMFKHIALSQAMLLKRENKAARLAAGDEIHIFAKLKLITEILRKRRITNYNSKGKYANSCDFFQVFLIYPCQVS